MAAFRNFLKKKEKLQYIVKKNLIQILDKNYDTNILQIAL